MNSEKNDEKLIAIKNQNMDGNKLLAELSLVPNADKVNTNRGVLWCSHLSQTLVLKNERPEIPLVFSGFENQLGQYSSGYSTLPPFKVIHKFYRNQYNYQLLIRYRDSKEYDIIYRTETHWLSEKYGYVWLNENMDSLEIGDKVNEDYIVKKNTTYDDNMNLCIGHNLLALFYSYKDMTHEDAIVMSDEVMDDFTHNDVINLSVSLNTNNLLLNLYGDDEHYKCFPDIGEDIIDGQLLIRRIINYDRALTELKDLKHYRDGDDVIYTKGKVVDIHVYCNSDKETLRNIPYYEQILRYLDKEDKYAEYTTNFLEKIMDKELDDCSDETILYYNKLKSSIDNNKFTLHDNEFDNIVIVFTIKKENKPKIGDKFTNRYGGKGVLSMIVPKEEMPVIEEGPLKGLHAQILLNPLGVINRMNPAQLFEQEINFIGLYVRKVIKDFLEEGDVESALEEFSFFIENVGTKLEYDCIEKYTDLLYNDGCDSDEELYSSCIVELLCEFVEEGIPVHQFPFKDNLDFFSLTDVYEIYEERYGIENLKFKFENIYEPMVMGEIEYVKLKHSTDNKSSMRSTGYVDLLDIPSKDRLFKDYKSLYPKTPIKLGEMECLYLLMSRDTTAVKELINSYGTSYDDEETLEYALLEGNPFEMDVKFPLSKSKPSVVKDRLLYGLGLELVD